MRVIKNHDEIIHGCEKCHSELGLNRKDFRLQSSGDINYKTFIANCVVCNEPIHKLLEDLPQNWQKEFS